MPPGNGIGAHVKQASYRGLFFTMLVVQIIKAGIFNSFLHFLQVFPKFHSAAQGEAGGQDIDQGQLGNP